MWYTDEEEVNKGIEEEEEEEEDDDDDVLDNRGGDHQRHRHHPALHEARLEAFMRSIDHGLSLLVHWSTKHWCGSASLLLFTNYLILELFFGRALQRECFIIYSLLCVCAVFIF